MKNDKPKFTPGPWESIVREERDGMWAYIGPVNERTYDILKMDACNDERQANAALIAAAPEMFEALEYTRTMLNEIHPENRELLKVINEAISKAKGEVK